MTGEVGGDAGGGQTKVIDKVILGEMINFQISVIKELKFDN